MGNLMCPARLVCLRPGEHVGYGRRLTSAAPGPGLTDAGHAQAKALIEPLRELGVSQVYASRLLRAHQTGAILAEGLGVRLDLLAGLAEYDLGAWEGRPNGRGPATGLLRSWLLDGALDRRLAGGESGYQVLDRFGGTLSDLADQHRGQTVAVVSHLGTLTLGLAALCSGLSPAALWEHPLGCCVPVLIENEGDGWYCRSGWPGRNGGPPLWPGG